LQNLNVQLYSFTAKPFNSKVTQSCLFTGNIYRDIIM